MPADNPWHHPLLRVRWSLHVCGPPILQLSRTLVALQPKKKGNRRASALRTHRFPTVERKSLCSGALWLGPSLLNLLSGSTGKVAPDLGRRLFHVLPARDPDRRSGGSELHLDQRRRNIQQMLASEEGPLAEF